jgi:hypothetical protein
MSILMSLIGVETEMSQVVAALREYAENLQPEAIGGYHLTCSDEAEWECAEAFQQLFGQVMLPALKSSRRAVFRTINLGARYEAGAIRMADRHFSLPMSDKGRKLIVAKVNSHVALRQAGGEPEYGWLDRYGIESPCCGALASALDEEPVAVGAKLRKLLRFDAVDRLHVLRDRYVVPPHTRALLAAIIHAQIQSLLIAVDLRDYRPLGPTVFLVLPCVTINRNGPDTELAVGRFMVDASGPTVSTRYQGLDNDPARYRIRYEHGRLHVNDGQWTG